jgi:hypothetical protein
MKKTTVLILFIQLLFYFNLFQSCKKRIPGLSSNSRNADTRPVIETEGRSTTLEANEIVVYFSQNPSSLWKTNLRINDTNVKKDDFTKLTQSLESCSKLDVQIDVCQGDLTSTTCSHESHQANNQNNPAHFRVIKIQNGELGALPDYIGDLTQQKLQEVKTVLTSIKEQQESVEGIVLLIEDTLPERVERYKALLCLKEAFPHLKESSPPKPSETHPISGTPRNLSSAKNDLIWEALNEVEFPFEFPCDFKSDILKTHLLNMTEEKTDSLRSDLKLIYEKAKKDTSWIHKQTSVDYDDAFAFILSDKCVCIENLSDCL